MKSFSQQSDPIPRSSQWLLVVLFSTVRALYALMTTKRKALILFTVQQRPLSSPPPPSRDPHPGQISSSSFVTAGGYLKQPKVERILCRMLDFISQKDSQ